MVGLVSQMSESDLSKMMGMLKGGAKPKEIPAVNGDFYELGKTLNPKEREIQLKVREFMEREIKPIANDYWNRAEFPMHIIPKMAELNIAGLTYHGYDCPGHSALLEGFIAMEMARVDTSISTFFSESKVAYRWDPSISVDQRSKSKRGCPKCRSWRKSEPSD